MNDNKVLMHFQLSTQAVAIGERVKAGTFRPCLETIPTSTLKGAFKEQFGLENIFAIGFFNNKLYEKAFFTYSPFDKAVNTSKLPITAEYLRPKTGFPQVLADIYIIKNEPAELLMNSMPSIISIGALKSKGFGRCGIKFIEEVAIKLKIGYLKGRMLEEEANAFEIRRIIKASYGYLFCPTNKITGVYKRSLFERSIIEGPEIMIDGEYQYDF
ncbi:MAG: hypothetical protein ABSC20_06020 [Candidatus Bathyarchaeia archaeon]